MNTSLTTRAAALAASMLVTFVIVDAIAILGHPRSSSPAERRIDAAMPDPSAPVCRGPSPTDAAPPTAA